MSERRSGCNGEHRITLFPSDADSADVLMRNADVAMYNAKARGRDNYRFFIRRNDARAVRKEARINTARCAGA